MTEQQAAVHMFRGLVAPLRLRVALDPEGFPVAPGRLGQLEWHTQDVVAIYSQSMRMQSKLLQIPGIQRHQMGDREFRLLLPVEKGHEKEVKEGLRAVAKLLGLRTRHTLSDRQKAALLVGRRPSPKGVRSSHAPPAPGR